MRNWHGNLSPFGQWHTGGRAFTPAFFFASGEPGLWLDPSDLTTLFQDSTGATPVTTPGQPVGLVLDKSQAPGASTSVTGWTNVGWDTFSSTGGSFTASKDISGGIDNCYSSNTIPVTLNSFYEITLDVASTTLASYSVALSLTTNNRSTVVVFSGAGTKRALVQANVASGNFNILVSTTVLGAISITSASVRLVTGNHATQSMAGSRPLYALLPANGVRNLANGSASVGNTTYWPATPVQNGITMTKVASGFDVDGLPYVDVRYQGTATGTFHALVYAQELSRSATASGQTFTASVLARVIGGSLTNVAGLGVNVAEETAPSTFVGQTTGNVVTSSTDTISTATRTISTGNQVRLAVGLAFTNGATIDVTYRIKGLQLELGSTRTAYQFNYSNVNIAQPPFAQVGALLFDGVDDFLQTPSVDFPGYEILGSELVTNGNFAVDANWDKGTGWSIGAGVATKVAGTASNLGQVVTPITAGRAYRVTFDLTVTAGSVDFLFTGGTTTFAATNLTTTQTVSVTATALGANNYFVFVANAAFAGTVDNVSVREVLRPADKVTVFAGVRKLSDASQGVLVELTSNASSTPNSFSLQAPGPATSYRIVSGGSLTAGAVYDATGLPAPRSSVLTGIANISGASASIRENGTQVAGGLANQGTGNYANAPLFIGRRGGTLIPFNGYIYSLIVRGAATTAAQIAEGELWVAGKSGFLPPTITGVPTVGVS